jgi:predicted LPLAT superfamily acyltransferase
VDAQPAGRAQLVAIPGAAPSCVAAVDGAGVMTQGPVAKLPEPRSEWLARRERGTRMGVRALLLVTRVLGRRGGRALLRVIMFYFVLFAPKARRASRQWYERVTGRSSFRSTYRHLLRFAEVALDRVFFVRGELDHFEFDRQGTELMRELVAAGRGAILLGAHFGSFEAMRAAARGASLPINILAHNDNARMIAAFLDEVSGGQSKVRVIEIDPNERTYILEVKRRIDAGELVAVLGDRLGLNDRSATVEFFGAPARFPTGPYIMASVLRCPVLTVFGTYVAPRRYVLRCELFAERVELPRNAREQALVGYVEQFARRLEHYARVAPDNWFNFHDFWCDSVGDAAGSRPEDDHPPN